MPNAHASNIVGANIAHKCEVQLAYCIGVAEPMSINIDTFNTGKFDDSVISNTINELCDLRPASIIKNLRLKNPIYQRFASNGHFGHEENCSWEELNLVEKIKEKMGKYEAI